MHGVFISLPPPLVLFGLYLTCVLSSLFLRERAGFGQRLNVPMRASDVLFVVTVG